MRESIVVKQAIVNLFEELISKRIILYSEADLQSLLSIELIHRVGEPIPYYYNGIPYKTSQIHREYPYTGISPDAKSHKVDLVMLRKDDIARINFPAPYLFISGENASGNTDRNEKGEKPKRSVLCSDLIELKVRRGTFTDVQSIKDIEGDFKNLRGQYAVYKKLNPDCNLYFVAYRIHGVTKASLEKQTKKLCEWYKECETPRKRIIYFYLLIGPDGPEKKWSKEFQKYDILKKNIKNKQILFF